jgi:cytosine/adenosine deaminase-related metal-dependent hydrolase
MPGQQLHSAPWVVPVSGTVLAQGGVVIEQGRILAVDVFPALQQQFPQAETVHHPHAALTPALINAHIHLELAHLDELSATPLNTSFTGWIQQLLDLREQRGAINDQVEAAAAQAAQLQYQQGTSVLADIGNTTIAQGVIPVFPGRLLDHKEYLGLAAFTLEKNLQRLATEEHTTRCCGHAPYSTHPQLLQGLKQRARRLDHVFPLHVAEIRAEGEMLAQGRGEMVDFIRSRGFWDGSFLPPGSSGSIHYLHELGVLDAQTFCVHAVHVDAEEIRILAGEGGKVCLCPGSNRFLQVGKAPVPQYLAAGLLPAIGTDSIASNPQLSMWREMALIAEDHPSIDAATIFAMATRGGAEALGLERDLGTLAPGKEADLLVVAVPEEIAAPEQLMHHLVSTGAEIQPQRILARG